MPAYGRTSGAILTNKQRVIENIVRLELTDTKHMISINYKLPYNTYIPEHISWSTKKDLDLCERRKQI